MCKELANTLAFGQLGCAQDLKATFIEDIKNLAPEGLKEASFEQLKMPVEGVLFTVKEQKEKPASLLETAASSKAVEKPTMAVGEALEYKKACVGECCCAVENVFLNKGGQCPCLTAYANYAKQGFQQTEKKNLVFCKDDSADSCIGAASPAGAALFARNLASYPARWRTSSSTRAGSARASP